MGAKSNRVFLEFDEAVAMLPDGEYVNVKLNPLGMLIGSDWSRSEVLSLLREGVPELSGETAAGMGFGIAVLRDGRYHFVETRGEQ